MGLKEKYVTISDLFNMEEKILVGVRDEDDLGRKFRKALWKMGFQEEMINWYATQQERTASGKRRGTYIFEGGDLKVICENLNDLIRFSKQIDKNGLCENFYDIIRILQDLLPWTKEKEIIDVLSDDQEKEIRKLFSMIDNVKKLNIFNIYEGKVKKRKEIVKVWEHIEAIDNSRSILLQESVGKEEYDIYIERKKQIERTVINFFLSKMNCTYFPNSLKKRIHREDCIKLYTKVGRWYTKWICLFDSMDGLHRVEDFYNIVNLFAYCEKNKEDVKYYYRNIKKLEGNMKEAYDSYPKLSIGSFSEYFERNYDDEKLIEIARGSSLKCDLEWKRDRKNKEEYFDLCNNFVEHIGKLKDKEDAAISYIKVEALHELNMITKSLQNNSDVISEKGMHENLTVNIDEELREQFAKSFKDCTKEEIRRECLDCIFYLKHTGQKTMADYVPYAKICCEKIAF